MENTEVIELLKEAFELKRQSKYKKAMELLYKALVISPDNVDILTQVADLHILLKNPTSACSILERLLEKQPDDVYVVDRLCSYYVSSLNYDKARVILSKFILSYPSKKAYEVYFEHLSKMKDFEKIYETYLDKRLQEYNSVLIDKFYGISLYYLNKYDEAQKIFSGVLNTEKYDEDLIFYHAQNLYKLGKTEDAYSLLLKYIGSTKSHKILNLFGEIELDKTHYEQAINMFSAAVKLKYDGLYFYNLGTAYFLNGQLKEAKMFYTKAVSASFEIKEYRYALAYVHYKLGDLVKSSQIIDEILNSYPDFREALILKVNIYYDQQKYYQAEKALSELKNKKPESDIEYLELEAKIAKALYRYEQAQNAYEKLVDLKPESADYKYELARLYFDALKYENAAQLLINIIVNKPQYVNAYVLISKIYVKMHDFKNVVTMAEKAIELDLNNEEAFYLKALGYTGLGNIDKAIETCKMLLAYNPHKVEVYALLGACYTEKNDYETAINYYNEAVILDSKNAEYFLNLAILYNKLNNKKEELRYLYMAHVLKPNNIETVQRLVEAYVEDKNYKLAIKLLGTQIENTTDFNRKQELKNNMDELEKKYKNSTNKLKYYLWKAFKI